MLLLVLDGFARLSIPGSSLQLFERQAAEDTGLQFVEDLPRLPAPAAEAQAGRSAAGAGDAQPGASRGAGRQQSAPRAQGMSLSIFFFLLYLRGISPDGGFRSWICC